MVEFILNNETIAADHPEGTPLVDFIRNEAALAGTKIGCREGDCGACTVLEGTLTGHTIVYKSIVSCLTPLGNVDGKHIVTLEGLNMETLSPIQQAMVDNAATQCGFCTPGFIMGFTAHALTESASNTDKAIAAVSGNICRCTGYKSIERAAAQIAKALQNKNTEDPVKWLVEHQFLPHYFLTIPARLADIEKPQYEYNSENGIIGGGTDLMVQKSDEIYGSDLNMFSNKTAFKKIEIDADTITIGSACTASDIAQNPEMQKRFPDIEQHFKLISSEPIRNAGTIAGNFVNASPIGDLSIFFLALNASITISDGSDKRNLLLKDFFLDYKKKDLKEGEFIENLSFNKPVGDLRFNFEKISKRTHLDIASVTSAISMVSDNTHIVECHVSAGGVKAIPLYLEKTSRFLEGKPFTTETLNKAIQELDKEISPISDVRGSAEYKKLLMQQILKAHFQVLFPESSNP